MSDEISNLENNFEISLSALFTSEVIINNSNPSKISSNPNIRGITDYLKSRTISKYICAEKILDVLKLSLSLADNRVLIASPYIDNNHVITLLTSLARNGVEVILLIRSMDNNYLKIKRLMKLHEYGGKIYLNDLLHLKMYLIDNFDFSIFFHTSANLTSSSLMKNFESAIFTNDPTLVESAKEDFLRIKKESIPAKIF